MSLDSDISAIPTISDLVSEALERGAASSERDIARKLKTSGTNVRAWREGASYPKNETAIRLAKLSGRDPCEVLAIVNYWRSKPADRIYIRRMIKYIRVGLVAALLLIFTVPNTPHARASIVQENSQNIHYARWLRLIIDSVQWLIGCTRDPAGQECRA
jgi:hypothetical protein